MTNIVSTASAVDHTSDAGFRSWVAEVVTALFTTLTLTQTSDTGQVNTATVTRPTTGTSPGVSGGYVIGRFNDSLQSTSPIFFKLEFGTFFNSTNSPANQPMMWITVGTGSNGSGTITGTTTVRSAVVSSNAITSFSATCISYFVYNSTQGFFAFMWKNGANNNLNVSYGGLILSRSTDVTGASTGDAYMLITNTNVPAAIGSGQGQAQGFSYLTGALVTITNNLFWTTNIAFSNTTTYYNGSVQVAPAWQCTPVLGINCNYAVGIFTEIPGGVTFTAALIGTTPMTYISTGGWFNTSTLQTSGVSGGTNLILWQ